MYSICSAKTRALVRFSNTAERRPAGTENQSDSPQFRDQRPDAKLNQLGSFNRLIQPIYSDPKRIDQPVYYCWACLQALLVFTPSLACYRCSTCRRLAARQPAISGRQIHPPPKANLLPAISRESVRSATKKPKEKAGKQFVHISRLNIRLCLERCCSV